MDTVDNRARVVLRPLDAVPPPRTPAGYTLLAVMDAPRSGWLARSNTGQLVCFTGAAVASIDARKAGRALEDLTMAQKTEDIIAPDELAAALRAWRGDNSVRAAAATLGLSPRTFEGIEQGRGFAHGKLLMLAMQAVKAG